MARINTLEVPVSAWNGPAHNHLLPGFLPPLHLSELGGTSLILKKKNPNQPINKQKTQDGISGQNGMERGRKIQGNPKGRRSSRGL